MRIIVPKDKDRESAITVIPARAAHKAPMLLLGGSRAEVLEKLRIVLAELKPELPQPAAGPPQ